MLLAITFLVSTVTLGTGRTHVMQGAVHLVLFATFLFLVVRTLGNRGQTPVYGATVASVMPLLLNASATKPERFICSMKS